MPRSLRGRFEPLDHFVLGHLSILGPLSTLGSPHAAKRFIGLAIVARRLLALAAIYDGATRTEAAKIGGVGLQIIRDWVLRFNARGPDGLLDGKSTGQPSKLNDTQRQAIAGMIESGPIPAVHGVVRWRLIDLAQWIFEEFRITIAKQTLSRELRAM